MVLFNCETPLTKITHTPVSFDPTKLTITSKEKC